jgi:hypothetical protein
MLKWLLKSLLILAIFVPFAGCLPLAAVSLCRTPEGAQFWFWFAPWSCCFWTLIYSTLSACPWRQGAEAVRQWRAEHGGLLWQSLLGCCWMFGSLIFSYVAEFLFLVSSRRVSLLPLASYAPLGFCWLWRKLCPTAP